MAWNQLFGGEAPKGTPANPTDDMKYNPYAVPAYNGPAAFLPALPPVQTQQPISPAPAISRQFNSEPNGQTAGMVKNDVRELNIQANPKSIIDNLSDFYKKTIIGETPGRIRDMVNKMPSNNQAAMPNTTELTNPVPTENVGFVNGKFVYQSTNPNPVSIPTGSVIFKNGQFLNKQKDVPDVSVDMASRLADPQADRTPYRVDYTEDGASRAAAATPNQPTPPTNTVTPALPYNLDDQIAQNRRDAENAAKLKQTGHDKIYTPAYMDDMRTIQKGGYRPMIPSQGNFDDYGIYGRSTSIEDALKSDNPEIRSLATAYLQGQQARNAAALQQATSPTQGRFQPTYAPTDGMVFRGNSESGRQPAPAPRNRMNDFDPAQFGTPDPINRDRTGGSYKTGRMTSIDPKTGQQWTTLMDSDPKSIAAAQRRGSGGKAAVSKDEQLVNALANPFMAKIGSEFDIAKPVASTGQKEIAERIIPGKGWIAGVRDYDPNRPANEMRGSASVLPGLSEEEKARYAEIKQRDAERQRQQEQLAFMEQTMERLAPAPNMSGLEKELAEGIAAQEKAASISGWGKKGQRQAAMEAADTRVKSTLARIGQANENYKSRQALAQGLMQTQASQRAAEQKNYFDQLRFMADQGNEQAKFELEKIKMQNDFRDKGQGRYLQAEANAIAEKRAQGKPGSLPAQFWKKTTDDTGTEYYAPNYAAFETKGAVQLPTNIDLGNPKASVEKGLIQPGAVYYTDKGLWTYDPKSNQLTKVNPGIYANPQFAPVYSDTGEDQ